jgi:hypothetical protein
MSDNELLEIIKKAKIEVKKYEELQQQGLLFILPCKIGTPIWRVYKQRSKWKVRQTKLYWDNVKEVLDGIGEIFFLTEVEAIDKKDELNGIVGVNFRSN